MKKAAALLACIVLAAAPARGFDELDDDDLMGFTGQAGIMLNSDQAERVPGGTLKFSDLPPGQRAMMLQALSGGAAGEGGADAFPSLSAVSHKLLSLSPEEQYRLIRNFQGKWDSMPDARKSQLVAGFTRQWDGMTEGERQALVSGFRRMWLSMDTAQQTEILQTARQSLSSLDPAQRDPFCRALDAAERYKGAHFSVEIRPAP
ncbi:MAG: DUF3106 domain-containing protein [Deltaproteobacteria bacterium]|nr:DUF3106 domain-containing protein [Deltaproteobacteria bacterium]